MRPLPGTVWPKACFRAAAPSGPLCSPVAASLSSVLSPGQSLALELVYVACFAGEAAQRAARRFLFSQLLQDQKRRRRAPQAPLMATASELKVKVSAWTGWQQSSVKTLFVATFAASFVANIFSTPFDVVKSRIQQQVGSEYSGMMDCARKSVAREGVTVLWRGFTPAFVKLAPYSIISITLFEKFTVLYTGGKGGAI